MLHLLCLNVNRRYWKRWYCMVLCSSHAIALDEGTEVRECNTHKKNREKRMKISKHWNIERKCTQEKWHTFLSRNETFRSTRDKRCMCDRRAHLHRNGSISCILRSTLRWKSLSVKEVLAEGMVHGLSILCRTVFLSLSFQGNAWLSKKVDFTS